MSSERTDLTKQIHIKPELKTAKPMDHLDDTLAILNRKALWGIQRSKASIRDKRFVRDSGNSLAGHFENIGYLWAKVKKGH